MSSGNALPHSSVFIVSNASTIAVFPDPFWPYMPNISPYPATSAFNADGMVIVPFFTFLKFSISKRRILTTGISIILIFITISIISGSCPKCQFDLLY